MTDERILHLDTTTSQLHVALSQAGEILCEQCFPCESHRYHSAMLVPAIRDLLSLAGFSVNDLTALAVNQGPGSFTGIRTGIITARTMAQFLNLPVYQFNAFELWAAQHDAPVSVYLDALRGKAYHATLQTENSGTRYVQTPTLIQLDSAVQPASLDGQQSDPLCIISPALADFFRLRETQVISEDRRPQMAMLRLIKNNSDAYLKTWSEIRPLYIQQPSVTVKKK